MPKKIKIEIAETSKYLRNEHLKAKGKLKKDCLKVLIYVKEGKYHFQSDIAKKLGRTEKTVRQWIQEYAQYGLSSLLKVSSGGNNTRKISEKALELIVNKIVDVETTITSYVELQLIIEEELGEKIAYGALYSHCRGKHKSRLKVARKSHHKKDEKAEELLKNLRFSLKQIRLGINKNSVTSVNLYFQDESRFGLITKQKRVVSARGIKPIGKYMHSYKYKWLWGCFSPITGESFCMTTTGVCKELFIEYLQEFSNHKPEELKIIVIDNAGFHSTKDIVLPANIVLMPIPPYCPELNPAEKVWQWMKDKIAMKLFDTLEILENKMDDLINKLEGSLIKSITGYDFYIKAFSSVFKV